MNSIRRFFDATVVLSAAALLMVLGARIIIDELQLLGAREVLRVADRHGPELPAEQVRQAAAVYDSMDWKRSDLLFDRLHMKVVSAQRRASSAGRSEVLLSEQKGLVRASKDLLALAPAKALAWCTLAQAELSLKGVDAGWKPALELCHATARRELGVVLRRIRIGLRLWPLLDDDLRHRTRNDLVAFLSSPGFETLAPDILARMVATLAPQRAQTVREVIAAYRPDQTGRYDQVLARAMPGEGGR